jgi:hypothetical protein
MDENDGMPRNRMPSYETVQEADACLGDVRRLLKALNLFFENPSPLVPYCVSEPTKGIAWAALEKLEEASEMLVPVKGGDT